MENVTERGAYWEPWTPKVGDRVRVRLNPECPLPDSPPSAGQVVQHYPKQDGLDGSVLAVEEWPRHAGHRYLVGLPVVNHKWCSCAAGYFAAAELEPIVPEER